MSIIKVKFRGTDNVAGRRNLIVNGAMNVSQRGTSFASPANGEKLLDQFRNAKSHDGAITVTQDSSGPSGFANSLKVDVTTADTSMGSSQYQHIWHRVEAQNLQSLAFGTSDAKNFTLSFYVKSNKTGTYAVVVGQNDNSFKQATLTYTINSADTWERKSLTFNGDTSGVINDDNGPGLEINFILAIGSNYTSGSASASFATYADANYAVGHAVNLLDNTSNEWFLTGVQLEVGDSASDFEHRLFAEELALCERYYQRWQAGQTYDYVCNGSMATDTRFFGVYQLSPDMRDDPTMNFNGTFKVNAQNGDMNASNFALNRATKMNVAFYCDTTDSDRVGNGALFRAGSDADAYVEFISEI